MLHSHNYLTFWLSVHNLVSMQFIYTPFQTVLN